jgi:hypothetical protein
VLIKLIVVCLLFFMIYNLYKAMRLMLKNEPSQPPMSKYIGRRVLTSAIIVIAILVAVATGVITPNPRPF